MNEEISELRKGLRIDEWLELVKEDKNLKGAYISFSQYMDILEKREKQLQNNWNELKKWLIQLQKFKGINQQGFSWGVAQEVLDKMQELEGNNVNTSN